MRQSQKMIKKASLELDEFDLQHNDGEYKSFLDENYPRKSIILNY
jgi:hypothetical protein